MEEGTLQTVKQKAGGMKQSEDLKEEERLDKVGITSLIY